MVYAQEECQSVLPRSNREELNLQAWQFSLPRGTEGFCSWLVVLFLKVAASEPSDGISLRDDRPMLPAQHLPSILPLDSPPFVPAMEVVEF